MLARIFGSASPRARLRSAAAVLASGLVFALGGPEPTAIAADGSAADAATTAEREIISYQDLDEEGHRVYRAYASGREIRHFDFDYEVIVPVVVGGRGSSRLFLPIAIDGVGQRISKVDIESDYPGRFLDDARSGNRYWVTELPADRTEEARVVIRYGVERAVVRAGDDRGSEAVAARYLAADERVVVGHPILDPILAEIRAKTPGADQATRARAIYDWVVDNIEYKKVGTGWGNGDTFWACNERYGNCTDFHSLFISLARTEGIPARFQMGFPIPDDRTAGEIGGYHCWVEFWLPDQGWIPIDASEASKHPEKRDLYYGTHPADRFQFTTGRDLRLGPEHEGRPLNYFIYPYLEVANQRSDADLRTRFRYRERDRGDRRPRGDRARPFSPGRSDPPGSPRRGAPIRRSR